MSAYSDNEQTGPFDGPTAGPFGGAAGGGSGHGRDADRASYQVEDDYDFDDEPRRIGPDDGSDGAPVGRSDRRASARSGGGGGLELVGAGLFLAGCLPAAAVAKALADNLNLAADGLGGTAALAAGVANWVGPWPALITGLAIAAIGALIMLGMIRSEPLRYVGGALVTGLGLSAVASGITGAALPGRLGSGGQLGSGMEGTLTDWFGAGFGPWATLILGLAVIVIALWLAFAQDGPRLDEDGLEDIVERNDAPRSSVGNAVAKAAGVAGAAGAAAVAAGGSLFRRPERSENEVLGKGADRQRRVSNKKVRRMGAPATLGDALARGGTEGVTHDEAAALAPDDKTLAYMENVWRRAAGAVEQPEPIPPSPYPEDVRLKGEIPDGAMPLAPRPHGEDTDEPKVETKPSVHGTAGPKAPLASDAYQSISQPVDPYTANPAASYEVAPFDFEDELSAPMPLNQAPPPALPGPHGAQDPFGAPAAPGALSREEVAAYEAAVLREGATAKGPSDLPPGVKPFTPKGETADAATEAAVEAQPGAPVEVPVDVQSGSNLEAHASPTSPNSISFERPEPPPGAGPVPVQAMQAGAMPASVSPPPRPAWEQGYDDEDTSDNVSDQDLAGAGGIPDVDQKGRWQRRDGEDESPVGLGIHGSEEEGEVSALSTLEDLIGNVDDLEWEEEPVSSEGIQESRADLQSPEAEVEAPEEILEEAVDLAPEEAVAESLEVEVEVEEDAEPEALEDSEEEPEEEAEADGEEEYEDEEAEYEEYEEYEEDEEDDEDEEDEEDEESAEAEGEVEYEYVDEDGNPIDPSELGEEYELVDEDEDEEEDEEDEEAAEYEEEEDEDEDEEAAEYEEDEEAAEYEEAEAEEEESPAGEAEDVILEPQAPPTVPETGEIATPGATSSDAMRILDAGRMVVQKDRAAVSVIQKGFGVEFAEACSILEELHAEGLIGPYQEGKKRAILLSLEEWEGRFAHS